MLIMVICIYITYHEHNSVVIVSPWMLLEEEKKEKKFGHSIDSISSFAAPLPIHRLPNMSFIPQQKNHYTLLSVKDYEKTSNSYTVKKNDRIGDRFRYIFL